MFTTAKVLFYFNINKDFFFFCKTILKKKKMLWLGIVLYCCPVKNKYNATLNTQVQN